MQTHSDHPGIDQLLQSHSRANILSLFDSTVSTHLEEIPHFEVSEIKKPVACMTCATCERVAWMGELVFTVPMLVSCRAYSNVQYVLTSLSEAKQQRASVLYSTSTVYDTRTTKQ